MNGEALRLREWQLGPGQPTLVLEQFSAEEFNLIVDDRADVHFSSKDGRFYLGWFPLGRPGTDGEAERADAVWPRPAPPGPVATHSRRSKTARASSQC